MPKPAIFTYEKKEPFRDAFYFLIVCEGQKTELAYFRFFDGLCSRVKIVAVANDAGSAPKYLVEKTKAAIEALGADEEDDQVWIAVDTDRWGEHALRELRDGGGQRGWRVVQSNPCFEVWLYHHAKPVVPEIQKTQPCSQWKPYIGTIIKGGFNPDIHPAWIQRATAHAKAAYEETGFFPHPGCTQVWRLAEALLPIIAKDLAAIRHRYPEPEVTD